MILHTKEYFFINGIKRNLYVHLEKPGYFTFTEHIQGKKKKEFRKQILPPSNRLVDR